MIRITQASREQALKALAAKSDMELKETTVSGLRRQLREIGINCILRGDEEIPLSKARKDEIFDEIFKEVERVRKADILEREFVDVLPHLESEDLTNYSQMAQEINADDKAALGGLTAETFKDFRTLVVDYLKTQNRKSKGYETELAKFTVKISALGSKIARYIDGMTNQHGISTAGSTKLRDLSRVAASFKDYISKEALTDIRTEMESKFDIYLKTSMFAQMSDYREEKKKHDANMSNNNQNSVKSVVADRLLDWAYKLLSELDDNTPKAEWRYISIALALVSGRRMVEIHCTGSFELIEGNSRALSFTGQAKVKAESLAEAYYKANPSYEIPTLIPAQLVYNAFKWLEKQGKKLESEKKVNQNLSPEIAPLVKPLGSLVEFYGFDREAKKLVKVETPVFVSKYGSERSFEQVHFTYHSMREIYNLCAYKAFGEAEGITDLLYAGLILGHDRAPDNQGKQTLTAMAYMDEFRLHPESKFVIN